MHANAQLENSHFICASGATASGIKLQWRVKFGPFRRRSDWLAEADGRLLARHAYWEKWLLSQTVINGLFVWPTRRLALLIRNIKLLWEKAACAQYACSEGRKACYWWRILLQSRRIIWIGARQSICSHRCGGGGVDAKKEAGRCTSNIIFSLLLKGAI